MTNLTYKIIAYKELTDFDTNDCIDWAKELLNKMNQPDSIRKLAQMRKPTNSKETLFLLENALNDLKIEPLTGEMALLSYCYYHIKNISKGKFIKKNLEQIFDFCTKHKFEKNVYDFHLLHWAWNDLDYRDQSDFWAGANKENIDSICIIVANDWIKKYFSLFEVKTEPIQTPKRQ